MNPRSPQWLWLFPLVYLLHIIEEVRGVGHDFNVSLNTFLILSAATWVLMIVGVVLAQRLGFPHFIAVCLGSTVFLNGLWHIFNSVTNRGFEAGVISGTLLFIPIGLVTLIGLRNSMRRQRYIVGASLGLVIQTIAAILAA